MRIKVDNRSETSNMKTRVFSRTFYHAVSFYQIITKNTNTKSLGNTQNISVIFLPQNSVNEERIYNPPTQGFLF